MCICICIYNIYIIWCVLFLHIFLETAYMHICYRPIHMLNPYEIWSEICLYIYIYQCIQRKCISTCVRQLKLRRNFSRITFFQEFGWGNSIQYSIPPDTIWYKIIVTYPGPSAYFKRNFHRSQPLILQVQASWIDSLGPSVEAKQTLKSNEPVGGYCSWLNQAGQPLNF